MRCLIPARDSPSASHLPPAAAGGPGSGRHMVSPLTTQPGTCHKGQQGETHTRVCGCIGLPVCPSGHPPFSELLLLRVPVVEPEAGRRPQQTHSRLTLTLCTGSPRDASRWQDSLAGLQQEWACPRLHIGQRLSEGRTPLPSLGLEEALPSTLKPSHLQATERQAKGWSHPCLPPGGLGFYTPWLFP